MKFACCQLDDGVGASAGFITVGGGAAATRKRRNIQEVVALDIQYTKPNQKMLKDFMLTYKM